MSKTGVITYSPTAAMRIICIVVTSHALARFFRYHVATGQISPLFTMDRPEGRDGGFDPGRHGSDRESGRGRFAPHDDERPPQASHGRSAQQARKLTPVLPAIPVRRST